MGADIHLFAEKRVGRCWHPAPEPVTEEESGRLAPAEALGDVGRPYELFSLLSGWPIGIRSKLVKLPTPFGGRGFPEDLSPCYREALPGRYAAYYDVSDGYGGASWLGLKELTALDWDQPVRHHSYVEARYAAYFHPDKPIPPEFPQDGALYYDLFCPAPAGTVRVEWSGSLREFVGCGDWFVEELSALAAGAELRVIYWFDF